MDIMRNNHAGHVTALPTKLKLAHLTVLMSVLSMPLTAEIELLPFLSTSSHGYGVKQGAADTDRGFAQSVNPGLNLQYQGSWLQSNLAVDHQALVYRDEQRENESYSSFNLDNRASFLRDQLQFQLSSSRSFRAAGNQFARYADEITNGDQMAKMDSHRANVMFSNTKLDWLNAKFNVGVGETATDRVSDPLLNDPTLTAFDLNNRQFNGNLQLNSARRDSLIFWDLAVNAAKTDRDTELDYYNRSGAATLGFTVLPGLALIGRGSYESNSNISLSEQYDNFRNFETVGAGLEWKISSRSWWNLTYNKIDDERGGTEYIGTEFNFQPSRRTQLNGSLDRRFFGRTAQVSGSYRLKNINMQLSFSDSVDSLLGFATNNPLFGLFVCPPGAAATLDNCILPPTPNYQLKPGEFPAAIQLPTDNLNESLVIRRNASYSLGYQFNRLKLQLQLGARRDIYLERDAETKDTYVNLSGSWQLSARNTLSMGTSLSDIKYLSDEIGSAQGLGQREGVQGSAELGFSRQMNSQLTGTLTARHVKVDFKQTEQDYRENRLSLDFSFKF
jgi:uncharacterized protein (PEP-CTERM system associated)